MKRIVYDKQCESSAMYNCLFSKFRFCYLITLPVIDCLTWKSDRESIFAEQDKHFLSRTTLKKSMGFPLVSFDLINQTTPMAASAILPSTLKNIETIGFIDLYDTF